MAQIVFQKMLADKLGCALGSLGENGFEILSGGLAAYDGDPASPNALKVVAKLGLSLSEHQSRQVNTGLIENADLVLVMTKGHLKIFQDRFHNQNVPVQMLSHQEVDVFDPYGGNEQDYFECLQEIEEKLKLLILKVLS